MLSIILLSFFQALVLNNFLGKQLSLLSIPSNTFQSPMLGMKTSTFGLSRWIGQTLTKYGKESSTQGVDANGVEDDSSYLSSLTVLYSKQLTVGTELSEIREGQETTENKNKKDTLPSIIQQPFSCQATNRLKLQHQRPKKPLATSQLQTKKRSSSKITSVQGGEGETKS